MQAFLRNNEVWRNLTLPTINTVFLLGKTVSSFPPIATNLAYSSLKFAGLMTLDLQIRSLIKNIKNFIVAVVYHCWITVFYTGTISFVGASNLILTVGGTGAAVMATLGFTSRALFLLNLMRPWGLLSLALHICLDIYTMVSDRSLLQEMHELTKSPSQSKRLQTIFRLFADKREHDSSDNELAIRIRSRIDKDTWQALKEKVDVLEQNWSWGVLKWLTSARQRRILFTTLIENISTHQKSAQANQGLNIVGYIAMAITRAHPYSTTEAVTNLAISVLYTSKFLWQKFQYIEQQLAIHDVHN